MMMRTRGVSGTFFNHHFGVPNLSKSVGSFISIGGDVPTEPPQDDIYTYYLPDPDKVLRVATGIYSWVDQGVDGRFLSSRGSGFVDKRPIYLDGAAFAWMPNDITASVTSPDIPGFNITGDGVVIDAHIFTQQFGAGDPIFSKWLEAGNQRSFNLTQAPNAINLSWSPDGTSVESVNSANIPDIEIQEFWIRAVLDFDNGSSLYELTFFISYDGIDYTMLGTPKLGVAVTSIFNGTAQVEIGNDLSGAALGFSGRIYSASLQDGLAGSTIISFDGVDAGGSNVPFVSSVSGETYTVNAPADMVQYDDTGNVWLTGEQLVSFDSAGGPADMVLPITVYLLCRQITWVDTKVLFAGFTADSTEITQSGLTPEIVASNPTDSANNPEMPVGDFKTIVVVYDGAGSSIRIENGTPFFGDFGNLDPGGFRLGDSISNVLEDNSNIEVISLLIYDVAHTNTQMAEVVAFMDTLKP